MLISGVVMMIAAKKLPQEVSEASKQQGKRVGTAFGIIFGAEAVLIGAAAIICNITNHFIFFVMALIVGIHFFPLAYVFHIGVHYAAGILITLLSLVTLLFIPEIIYVSGN